MRILFLSQYFPPEIEPSATKIYDISRKLIQKGHQVTVITGFPNYPNGVIPPRYRKKYFEEENIHSIRVLRTFVFPSSNKIFYRRLLGELSFMFTGTIISLILERHDIIMTSSPPLEIGLSAYIISLAKKCPFIFEVRDIWPKAAVVLGVLNNTTMINIAQIIEHLIYKKAQHVIAVTKGIENYLTDLKLNKKKITLIRNGVDTNIFEFGGDNHEIKRGLKLDGKFICIYTGTHGLQAKLIAVLKAASLLIKEEDIAFLFLGDGAQKHQMVQFKKEKALKNVTFIDPQPHHLIPNYLSIADIGIVHTGKDKFFEGYLPVKLFEYMACGCPVVLANNGEAKDLIEEAEAGIWAEPENPLSLKEAILKLRDDPQLRKNLGENGREYVTKYLSRDVLIDEYERLFVKLVKE